MSEPSRTFSFLEADWEVEEGENTPPDRSQGTERHVKYRGFQLSHVSHFLWGKIEGSFKAEAVGRGWKQQHTFTSVLRDPSGLPESILSGADGPRLISEKEREQCLTESWLKHKENGWDTVLYHPSTNRNAHKFGTKCFYKASWDFFSRKITILEILGICTTATMLM